MTDVTITHIGGPDCADRDRPLADPHRPDVRPAGQALLLRLGHGVKKLTGPAVPFGTSSRSMRCSSRTTTTATTSTPPAASCCRGSGRSSRRSPGAKRLGGGAIGLAPWATTTLEAEGRPPLEITATPCRHGPPGSHPIVGDVIGFALRWEGQEHGALWISGDTVLYDGVREVARPVDVGTAIVHLGGVRFPVSGPLRYTMTAEDAVDAVRPARPAGDRPDPLRGLEALPPGPLCRRARVHGVAARGARALARGRHADRHHRVSAGRPADADDAGGVGRGGARRDRGRRGPRAVGPVGRPPPRASARAASTTISPTAARCCARPWRSGRQRQVTGARRALRRDRRSAPAAARAAALLRASRSSRP